MAMLMLAAGLEQKQHHISGVPVPIELLQLDPEVKGTPILGHPKLEMLPYGEKAALRELAKAVMVRLGVMLDAMQCAGCNPLWCLPALCSPVATHSCRITPTGQTVAMTHPATAWQQHPPPPRQPQHT